MKKRSTVLFFVITSFLTFSSVFAGGPNCEKGQIYEGKWHQTGYKILGTVGPMAYQGLTTCEITYGNRLGEYKPQVDVETDRWYDDNVSVPSAGTIVTNTVIIQKSSDDSSEYSVIGINPLMGKAPRLPKDYRIVDARWILDDIFVTYTTIDGGYRGSVKLWIDNSTGDTFVVLPDGSLCTVLEVPPVS